MLRFFRKYILNKFVLVTVGCLLMVMFLIQGTVDQLFGSASDPVIGTLAGQNVRRSDVIGAAYQLRVLDRIPPLNQLTATMLDAEQGRDLQWYLMLYDARRIGLSASDLEVANVLRRLGIDEAQMARDLETRPEMIRESIRGWLTLDQYQHLVRGTTYQPVVMRLDQYQQDLAQVFSATQNLRIAAENAFIRFALGSQRLSVPLVEHFLQQQRSTVSGEAVLISAERYLDEAAEPTDAEVRKLFEQYRDDLPGQGEPYGFGYRFPDRVRIEYLTIPIDRCMAAIEVDEAEAYEAYEQNKNLIAQNFASSDGTPPPYTEVREQVITALTRQEAIALADKMIKTAQSILYESQRGLSEKDGYKVLPDDFTPLSLEAVAQQLEAQEKFLGVRPQVHDYTEGWVAVSELLELPGLLSVLASQTDVRLPEYVLSARQLNPEADNPLTPLRLQAGVPSRPLIGIDDSRLIFRLTEAESARTPTELEEVRGRVVADARRLAAYRMLLSRKDTWRDKAIGAGVAGLAAELGSPPISIPPTPRRDSTRGRNAVPTITGIGQSEAFVNALFDTAETIATADGIADASAAQRTGDAGLDGQLRLAVFQLDSYQPITRSQYDRELRDGWRSLGPDLTLTMLRGEDDPLRFENLAKRLKYVPEGAEEQEGPEAESQSAAAQ